MKSITASYKKNGLHGQRALKHLHSELFDLYRVSVRCLNQMAGLPNEGLALSRVGRQISEILILVKKWLVQPDPPEAVAVRSELHSYAEKALRGLEVEPYGNHHARLGWTELIARLTEADLALAELIQSSELEEHLSEPKVTQVDLPAELLYQAHYQLFPAEKMMVASGRREGAQTRLYALFDVTGECHSGYVRADPAALGRALIAMENSGSFLMAWLHSHPGAGVEATHPSNIDQGQYRDWLQHFSPDLVCAILVKDGWVRFWGENLENQAYQLHFIGNGVRKEDDHGCLYKLSF